MTLMNYCGLLLQTPSRYSMTSIRAKYVKNHITQAISVKQKAYRKCHSYFQSQFVSSSSCFERNTKIPLINKYFSNSADFCQRKAEKIPATLVCIVES